MKKFELSKAEITYLWFDRSRNPKNVRGILHGEVEYEGETLELTFYGDDFECTYEGELLNLGLKDLKKVVNDMTEEEMEIVATDEEYNAFVENLYC